MGATSEQTRFRVESYVVVFGVSLFPSWGMPVFDDYSLRVLTIMVPAAFFSAIDTSFTTPTGIETVDYVSDDVRDQFLQMSRGFSIILLLV